MSLTGKIMDFFADKAMTIPAFPRTKVKAVSDDNNVGLDAILDDMNSKISNLSAGEVIPDKLPIVPIDKGGTDATTAEGARDNLGITRLYTSMVPYGTNIPANSDLNATSFLKVGNYYCSADATVETFTNCPTDRAFMMQVYSPISTGIDNETASGWVYRIRKIITYTGDEYIQSVSSGSTAGYFTFGNWKRITANVLTSDDYGTSLPAAGTAGRIFFKKVSS